MKGIIAGMLEVLEKDGATPRDDQWIADIDAWRARYPFYHPNMAENEESDEIVPELVIAELGRQLDPAASIVTTEVGQHQMWAHQFLPREFPRTFLSSGGLGTMASVSRPPSERRWRTPMPRWSASPATGRSR